jgi:hypothetical protein
MKNKKLGIKVIDKINNDQKTSTKKNGYKIKLSNNSRLKKKESKQEYVDDIQTQVSPLSPQISKNEQNKDQKDKEVSKDEIEEIKTKRKVNQLKQEQNKKQSDKLKGDLADELIDIAVMKDMIAEEDVEIEKQKIIAMNDEEYKKYKEKVVNYEVNGEVTSKEDEFEDKEELSEAEKMLQRVKGTGGNIGDFSKGPSKSSMPSPSSMPQQSQSNDNNKRSLSEAKNKNLSNSITFDNQQAPPSFKDGVAANLSKQFNQQNNQTSNQQSNQMSNQQKTANKQTKEAKKELPGFEDLQGLTKPLQISDKSSSKYPSNSNIKQLIENLDWTTMSKVH